MIYARIVDTLHWRSIPGFVVGVAAGWMASVHLQVPAMKYDMKPKRIRKSPYSVHPSSPVLDRYTTGKTGKALFCFLGLSLDYYVF